MTAQKKKNTPSKKSASSSWAEFPTFPSLLKKDMVYYVFPAFLFIGFAIYFLSASPFAWSDFPLDDAWIHRVYAQSFATGHGFAYNPGQQEAGATSPLWAIVTAPAHWLEGFGVQTVAGTVKIIGLVIGLIALLFVQRLAGMFSGSNTIGLVGAVLFLAEPRFVFSALSGMENILLFALIVAGMFGMFTKRWFLASICFGLAPVTRPEAILILPLYAGMLFLFRRKNPGRARLLVWLSPLIPMALWSLFCLMVNGHLLPNTFYLKAEPFHLKNAQIQTAWTILTQHGPSATFLLFAGLAVFLAWMFRHPRGLALWSSLFGIAFPVIFAVAVTGSRTVDPGGYYWTRWIDPGSLVLSMTVSFGLAILISPVFDRGLFAQMLRWLKERPWGIYAISGIGLACIALASPSMTRSLEDRRFHLWSDSRAIHLVNVVAGEWIDRTIPQNATVGVNDAGAIRYFGKRHTIDLKGLNYSDFAFGKIKPMQVIQKTDWLAVFPSWFQQSNLFDYFEERKSFSIPLTEYTVCDCPGQTTKVIFQKKK